ncbi:hypothetical protein BDW66DRAFT_124955 [Aspergillus desertorum]
MRPMRLRQVAIKSDRLPSACHELQTSGIAGWRWGQLPQITADGERKGWTLETTLNMALHITPTRLVRRPGP